jgi:hypothetical protein
MHIWDEHVCDGEIKQHMKRFFGAKTSAPSMAPASTSTVPQVPPSQQPSTSVTSTAETEMDLGVMHVDQKLQSQSPDDSDATNEFNHITGSFARQTGEDDDDGDVQMPSVISIEIMMLFNFTNKSWIPSHEHSTSQSLDEELELYKLPDLDAPGEEDINVEIDNALDSVLHHV